MLYTVGYQQRDLGELLSLLSDHDVEVLVDVRGTPRSRKAGFSKTRLADALDGAGIEYRHERDLGVPSEEREAFRDGEPAALERYRERLDGDARPALDRVVRTARDRAVALLCFEREEDACHRRLVAEAAQDLDPSLRHTALE